MKKGYDDGMKAEYTPDEIDTGDSNPYFDALPRYSDEEVDAHLSDPVKFFRSEWKKGSKEFRIEQLEFMRERIFVGRPCHIEAYKAFRAKMRSRYCGMAFRDPKFFLPNRPAYAGRNCARNIGIFGTPGAGKTVTFDAITSLFPSAIVHEEYKGHKMTQIQTPCLRVVCGASGGAKALNLEIISAYNDLTGGCYSESASGPDAQRQISQLVKTAAIGVIIIDEIQNVLLAKGYREDALSTLTRLNEKCGIPLVLIGTEAAKLAIEATPHTARRACGFGKWRAMKFGTEWEKWLRKVLSYGLTKKPVSYEKFGRLIFNYSGGIPDDAIGVFIAGQILALKANREEVLLKDFCLAMKENLYMRKRTLKEHRALRKTQVHKDSREKNDEIHDEPTDYGTVADNGAAASEDEEGSE